MADLRLIVVLLAACNTAGADAEPKVASGLTPPAGWSPQPAIAEAAKAALGKRQAVDGIEAYGEPAMGCYALWMALRGSGTASEVAEQLVRGLTVDAKSPRTLAISDIVKPTAAEGVLSFAFASPPYRGRLRARLGKGKIVTLACWSADREPVACETACVSLLSGGVP